IPGRRPRLLPGALVAGVLRPGLPGRAPDGGTAQPVPPGGRRWWPVVVSASLVDAGLLAVPHRVDGARTTHGHLSGTVPEIFALPWPGRHDATQGVGLP